MLYSWGEIATWQNGVVQVRSEAFLPGCYLFSVELQ
jgi:hypothetical protein